jgi:hypothetical protein
MLLDLILTSDATVNSPVAFHNPNTNAGNPPISAIHKKETVSKAASAKVAPLYIPPEQKLIFNLQVLGRHGGLFSFQVETEMGRNIWRDTVDKIKKTRAKYYIFELLPLMDTGLPTTNRINCSSCFNDRLVIGTDDGLYLGVEGSAVRPVEEGLKSMIRIVDLEKIHQVEVLKEHEIMIVLSGTDPFLVVQF